MKKNPHILCISPFFIPMADPEAFCGAKMVMALMNAGCDVTVLRWDTREQSYRGTDTSSLWQPAIAASLTVDPPTHHSRSSSLYCALRYQSISYARWIDAVVHKSESLHRERSFDLVYSRSLPMIAHIAGYWCSKALGLPWVANINDPWDLHLFPGSTIQSSLTYRAFSNMWLHKVLRSATLLTYPSSRLRDYHHRLTGIEHKTAIIPHIGWTRNSGIQPGSIFHLVHAGRLEDEIGTKRSSLELLTGLKQFLESNSQAHSKVHLTLVGRDNVQAQDLIRRLGLQAVVTYTGRVSYEESVRHISSASVCVLVEGKMDEGIYLTSKFVDYIVAGKPVMALSPAKGTIADYCPCKWLRRVDRDNVSEIAAVIDLFYMAHQENRLHDESPPGHIVAGFKGESVARQFLMALGDHTDLVGVGS